jgi:hypothetical protein
MLETQPPGINVSSGLLDYPCHNDNTLDVPGKGFFATLLPVIGALGLLSQHHGRAMGEKMYWCETFTMISSFLSPLFFSLFFFFSWEKSPPTRSPF